MKVFMTKYALTTGIEEIDAEDVGDGMIRVTGRGLPFYLHGEDRDWCRTHQRAVDRAEAMRAAKIAALRRQIGRLEGKSFA